tara:strand:- start:635 stop:1372 length:738 start_codon:yes stop_codon:yes gene_type:complete
VNLAQIWRYPIKSHGSEYLDAIDICSGKTLPLDRTWAVVHDQSDADGSTWVPCRNFSRVAKAPQLAAISTSWTSDEKLELSHPSIGKICINPDFDSAEFINWVSPLMPKNRSSSIKLVRSIQTGMTDTDFPSISIGNLSSHQEVEKQHGQELSLLRWRCNLWIDGCEPWAENEWIGKTLKIGDVTFRVQEEIVRCLATTANPITGIRDVDTLGILESMGQDDFTVAAIATSSGRIKSGDAVEIIS